MTPKGKAREKGREIRRRSWPTDVRLIPGNYPADRNRPGFIDIVIRVGRRKRTPIRDPVVLFGRTATNEGFASLLAG
jgi:hypothetical protein